MSFYIAFVFVVTCSHITYVFDLQPVDFRVNSTYHVLSQSHLHRKFDRDRHVDYRKWMSINCSM